MKKNSTVNNGTCENQLNCRKVKHHTTVKSKNAKRYNIKSLQITTCHKFYVPWKGSNQLVFPESEGPTKSNLVSFIGNMCGIKSW